MSPVISVGMPVETPAPRVLLLSPDELAAVVAAAQRADVQLRFAPEVLSGADEAGTAGAVSGLVARGVLDERGVVHPSVLAGFFAVSPLVSPAIVQVRASGGARTRVSWLGTLEGLGATLTRDVSVPESEDVTLAPIEQRVFPVEVVAEVLERLVPATVVDLGGPDRRRALRGADPAAIRAYLGAEADGSQDVTDVLADIVDWDARERAVLRDLGGAYSGSLVVTVSSRLDEGEITGRLVWVATAGGWWQLSPTVDDDGVPVLDIEPVVPSMLALAVAPMLATATAVSALQADPGGMS